MVSQGSNGSHPSGAEQPTPGPDKSGEHAGPDKPGTHPGPDKAGKHPGRSHPSADQVLAALTAFHDWVLRPRVRLTLIGVGLLLIGALMLTNSVWTLPLVIIGALMVAIAWVGRRLEGRVAVQWGESGTELAFRARIRAPDPGRRPALLAAGLGPSEPPEPSDGKSAETENDDVIDGHAHTVEIEVAELEALIAAAEAQEGSGGGTNGTAAPRDRLRVAYGGGRRGDAAS